MNQTEQLEDGGAPFEATAEADAQAETLDRSDAQASLKAFGITDQPGPDREIEQLPPGETGVRLVFDKPRARNSEHMVAEFDAALIRMAQRGVRTFTNTDVITEMAVTVSESTISKRFKGLCDDGDHVRLAPPDGLTIERLDRGRFALVRLSE